MLSSYPQHAVIDGITITAETPASALADIAERARRSEGFSVFTLNLDHLVKRRSQNAFKDAYALADIVTADGAPVVWLAKRQAPAMQRTTGADLVEPIVRLAADRGLPIFLFGTTDEVLQKTAQAFQRLTDGRIEIAGTLSPSASFNPSGAEADRALDTITATGARLVLVALGAPKQELFAAYARSKGVACGFICIGAGLDFIAGSQIRAPLFFQNNGLEWVWRLVTNPQRLSVRYLKCAMVLAELAILEPLKRRFSARPVSPVHTPSAQRGARPTDG